MVTIITEKLRNQSLQDAFEALPKAKDLRHSWDVTTSSADDTADTFCTHQLGAGELCEPCKPVSLGSQWTGGSHPPAKVFDNTKPEKPPDSDNVEWKIPKETWKVPEDNVVWKIPEQPLTPGSAKSHRYSLGSQPTPVTCIHNVNKSTCLLCDCLPAPTPPTKRVCRPLSMPPPGKDRKWQPQASKIWRPVPMKPHLTGSSKLHKSRHSPLHRKSSHSPALDTCYKPIIPVTQQPEDAEPPSYRFSPAIPNTSSTLWSSSETFFTPPESPVPRPVSASSGYSDCSATNVIRHSSSPLRISGLRSSSPARVCGLRASSPLRVSGLRSEFCRLRSISMDEESNLLNVTNVGSQIKNSEALSMPVLDQHPGSTPSSPRVNRPRAGVPRCRSQPSFVRERRLSGGHGGVKRRHDDQRPTLDFFKMKETSYENTWRRPKSVQFSAEVSHSSRNLKSIYLDQDGVHVLHNLDTIASSPLDCHANPIGGTVPHKDAANHPRDSPTRVFPNHSGDSRTSGFSHLTRDSPLEGVAFDQNSDTEDPPHILSLTDGDTSYDPENDLDEGQVFDLEMNNDLDLDQIEKD